MINGPTLLFTAIAVLIRTPVYLLSLLGSGVDMRGRSADRLVRAARVEFAAADSVAGFCRSARQRRLFSVCSLVVLVSVVLHGGSPMLLARAARKKAIREGAENADWVVRSSAERQRTKEHDQPDCTIRTATNKP